MHATSAHEGDEAASSPDDSRDAVERDAEESGAEPSAGERQHEFDVTDVESEPALVTHQDPPPPLRGEQPAAAVPPAPETVKASRINPDDRRFVQAITAGVIVAGLVAFAISFVALMDIAAWLGLPDWMSWAVPVFIDLAILVYAGSALIHKARGERTWPSWLLLLVFTGLSVIANSAHAIANGRTEESWQGIVGAVVAGMVPVAVFSATEQLSRVAVESPVSRRAELHAASEWSAAQAERERERRELEVERDRARREAELAREEHETQLAQLRIARQAHLQQASTAPAPPDHSNVSPAVAPVPAEEAPPEPERPSGDIDSVAEFVIARLAQGLDTSGADIGKEFGFTDKTGRRRLAQLRSERPEIFEADDERGVES